jgi:23S rRNA (cytosine1962-C5)-methyltransferase
MSSVILKKGKEHRLVAGHCWVYSGEIDALSEEVQDGDAVEIRDHKDRYLGSGLINRQSQITVRRFTTLKEDINEDFFRRRLQAALQHRRHVCPGATAYRVVFSESDLVPGLVMDWFDGVLVVQALTLGIDQRKKMILKVAQEILKPRAIIERSDVPTRRLEGLPEQTGVLAGATDGMVDFEVGGVKWEADLLHDQKTGFFLDQAENYRIVGDLCAGKKVLDCFSYHGGFSLYAASRGAKVVESVESSEQAVTRARKNTERNGLTGKIEFTCANAFDVLKKYDQEKRQFDVIVLDPPTFTRTRQNIEGAARGYKEINLRALKMLPPGGVLATFSCSHHIKPDMFREIILESAADAKRTVRLVRTLTQSPDHPILPAIPETEYLKGLLLEVMAS